MKLKNLAIDIANTNNSDDTLISEHNKHINLVNQSGLPLWVGDMYDNVVSLEEEVESSNPRIVLSFTTFIHSSTGLDYLAYHGNWEDSYVDYLKENDFFEQDPALPF
jgi:hypothetical protein